MTNMESSAPIRSEMTDGHAFDLYDHAPVGYCTISDTGVILEANTTLADLVGSTPTELTGQQFNRHILIEDRDTWDLLIKQVLATQGAPTGQSSTEVRMASSDGSALWVQMMIGWHAGDGTAALRVIIVDSTAEREREAIRAKAAMERMAAEISDGLFTLDHSWLFTYASEKAASLIGRSQEELIGECVWDLFPHAKESKFSENYHRAVETGQTQRFEEYYPAPLDAWFECGAHPTSEGLTVYFRDVTVERLEATELQRISAHQQAILDAIPDLLFEVGADGRILSYHSPHAELLAAPPEAFLGKTIRDLLPTAAAEIGMATIHDALQHGSSSGAVYSLQLPQGEHWFELSASAGPITVEFGQVIIVLARDITDRQQLNDQLTAHEALLVNLSEQIPGVVYQYRLDPDGSSSFPYASGGMNEIYEVAPREVSEDATPVFGRLHPDDLDRVSELIQDSARTLAVFECDFRVILPLQGERWRRSRARPERLADGGTLWHGIIYDITDRKRVEDQLRDSLEKSRLQLDVATRLQRMSVGRELRMVELKLEVNELCGHLGRPPRYPVAGDGQ